MKKIILFVLIALLIIWVVTVMLINPLRKSEDRIRQDILSITTLGTNMENVIEIIENNENWKIDFINDEYGYLVFDGRPSDPIYVDPSDTIVGVKSLRAHIGGYRNVFETDVIVFWGFDEDSKLIDVAVRKDTDAL